MSSINKILVFVLAIMVIASCKKSDLSATGSGRFEINLRNSSVDGNLIMGVPVNSTNTFTLVFKNAPKGAMASISADSVNGLSIKPITVALNKDSVKVPLSGTPQYDGTFLISVKVLIDGTTYVATKEFYVDLPNYTAISSTLPMDTTINNVIDSVKVNFQIDPYTTTFTIAAPPHLTAQVIKNSRSDRTLILYADNQFTSGKLVITSSFNNVPSIVDTIRVSAFGGGDGTAAKPFQIADTARLSKIQFAPDKNYQLIADIVAPKATLAATVLTGSLDGNGKTISNYVLNSATNNSGFFAGIGSTATVQNLSFANISVTGKDYTGGLAGVNNGTVNNVTVAGTVTGANDVAGIIGNNFGTITASDASNANVSGANYIATLAGNVNSGSSEAGNIVLATSSSFPTELYGVASTVTKTLSFTPASGTITVTSVPANLTVTSSGQQITLSPGAGFISGNVRLTLKSGKLSIVKDVMVYSKTAGAVFDAGNGSSTNPYVISTEAALDSIINAPSKYYQLAANITITQPWVPIPAFSGSLDGQGFKVNNLSLSATTSNNGFVRTNTGTIKNIQFLNVSFATTANTMGVVAGTNSGGTLQNVIVSGSLSSTSTGDTLGGLVGTLSNGGKVTQCHAKINIVSSCGMVGGLVGCLSTTSGSTSEISFSSTAGSIEITAAKTRIGGILGRAGGSVVSGGIVKNCASSMAIKSSGATSGNANGFGGIFGADQNAGIVPIDQCMFTGTVTSGFSIGGIAGVGSAITNCLVAGNGPALGTPMLYATGSSPATGSVGGIAGTDKVSLQYCIVKNATLTAAVTTAALPAAGITSTYQNNGYTANSVVINTSIAGSNDYAFRVSGTAANGTGVNANNYAGPGVTTPGRATSYVDNAAGLDGAIQTSMPFSFFTGLGFSSSIWKTDTDGYPTLINVGYNGGYALPQ